MKRIAIVTATRAEYGLLVPLIERVLDTSDMSLDLIVTGAHLSEKYGNTIDVIRQDGYPISYMIPILDADNSPHGISVTMANALKGFADCFRDDRPDILVILGDRTEMLGVAGAAMNERIPIAHIHGGEVTAGAVDDCVRHAITKMSYLHFTATEKYRERVIKMGEDPARVYNVGSLGTENILHQELIGRNELFSNLNISTDKPYAVVTYHPVTLTDDNTGSDVRELCKAMENCEDVFFIVTATNADTGGEKANEILRDYCETHKNGVFIYNLGLKRYMSALKYASFVLGNSSSGIIEAPVIGTPTVNIGDRQKGRLIAETVIDCDANEDSIVKAIRKAMFRPHHSTELFGDGNTSASIVDTLREWLDSGRINLKKGFYDIGMME